MVKLYHH